MMADSKVKRVWWKEEVIYQIYPRSFKDSNGDGIGDIRGIISKLDYLKDLGIDIIWICPIYQSPNDDNGYDVSDYYTIHPEFGTMEDLEELIQGVHDRGMKILLDLVANHTSDEHKWFEESRRSLDNPYRYYYYWRKGVNGGPPNNWKSFFGGSAWQYDETTDEYYLHLFSKKQPDLNWENSEVRKGICDVIQYWIDKGVDGFRMDVMPLISKRLDFSDSPYEGLNETIEKIYSNGPRVHEFINQMYTEVLQHHDVLTVGEGPGITTNVGLDYVGEDRGELNMIFHLDHMFLGHGPGGKFDPVPYGWSDVKRIFSEWDAAMGTTGWVSIFLDNHDFPRLVSRFGNDQKYRVESAKMLALMILTLRGTPSIYQGSELGMTNVKFPNLDDYKDMETINYFTEMSKDGLSKEVFLERVYEHGRDNARTPIQWNDSEHGGFTSGQPWIAANENYKTINAQACLADQGSIFYWYRELLLFRKKHLTLVYGDWKVLPVDNENLYLYLREDQEAKFLVMLNHSDDKQPFDIDLTGMSLCFCNYDTIESDRLKPWEGRLYLCTVSTT